MLDERRIDQIIQQVMIELHQSEAGPHAHLPEVEPTAPSGPSPSLRHGSNLFPEVEPAVQAARRAFEQLLVMPLAVREQIVGHMRRAARENAQLLAREAVDETGMGRLEDKTQKNLLNATKVPGPEILQPTVWTGDFGLTLLEYAPYGVIGSIIPSTNPTSTVICNAIGMVAAGNAVVFNAHPGAKSCSNLAVQLMHEAVVEAGGPSNLISAISDPTIETAQQVMRHPLINLLVVTGGPGVVQAAMQSGKRAICAGPGNPPIVVDETADLEKAGRGIVRGASFDNNVVCIDEKEVLAVSSIADELKRSICTHGGLEIDANSLERLLKLIFVQPPLPGKPGEVNKQLIGKNAGTLLEQIGRPAGAEIRLILAEVERDHPLVLSEQMMPILPLVRVSNADEGIDLARQVEHGFRHTAVMYSKNLDHLSRMARVMDCSLFVKNAPALAGLGDEGEGFCSFTIASPTGEGVTNPISFSRIRRCTLKDAFRIV
jgi:aldehyde dehydrogenase